MEQQPTKAIAVTIEERHEKVVKKVKALLEVAFKMRDAQKEYLKTRERIWLIRAKSLEAKHDEALEEVFTCLRREGEL